MKVSALVACSLWPRKARSQVVRAHAALIRAFSHLSDDPDRLTGEERAEVIAEMRAARQVLTDIIDAAEAAQ